MRRNGCFPQLIKRKTTLQLLQPLRDHCANGMITVLRESGHQKQEQMASESVAKRNRRFHARKVQAKTQQMQCARPIQKRHGQKPPRRECMEVAALLGGKCSACGFDKYQSALQMHHLDPSTKDKAFASIRGWSEERILEEIKGCVLLCACCHAAVHSGELTIGV